MRRFRIEDLVHPEMHVVAKQFVCAVCLNIVEDPVQTACSHIYCKRCISPCELCPQCREPVSIQKVKPLAECNKPMMRLMQDIKVQCPYSVPKVAGIETSALHDIARPLKKARVEEGAEADALPDEETTSKVERKPCSWTGSYGDLLVKHLQECPFHWIACPRGCGEEHRRCDAEAHAASCSKFFESCKYCGERVRPEDMADHCKQAAELHVQILEEKLAGKATKDEVSSVLSDGLDKVERNFEKVAKTSHVSNVLKQRSDEVKQTIQEAKDEIKQEMWDCMRKGVIWVIEDWSSKLRLSKATPIISPEFNLLGFSGLHMTMFPRGDAHPVHPTPAGRCALFIRCGGNGELMKFDVQVNGVSCKLTKAHGKFQGCVEPPMPTPVDNKVTITIALNEYYESV